MYNNIFEYFDDVVARHICLINVSYLQLSELLFKLIFLKIKRFSNKDILDAELWAVKVASTKSLTPYELGASEETYYGMINTEVCQSV